ncbi:MAG: glycosyltransferase family 39 protein, partial [Endomicrobia bacterium]|nr:glycosyltransferase family 39 protein [Endomicrobiia bacterium]
MLFSLYQNKQIKLIFLCVVSVITLFHRLNQSPLGYDDVFYAQRAKEMLLNSDWFFTKPTYGGELLFDNKPPMLYWFLCLSGKIFGFNNWSMRLFPGLFGFFTVIFVFFVVLKIFNSYELGFLSSFILNF